MSKFFNRLDAYVSGRFGLMTVGKWMKKIREGKSEPNTKAWLARTIGANEKTIARWEDDGNRPTEPYMRAWAIAVMVDPDEAISRLNGTHHLEADEIRDSQSSPKQNNANGNLIEWINEIHLPPEIIARSVVVLAEMNQPKQREVLSKIELKTLDKLVPVLIDTWKELAKQKEKQDDAEIKRLQMKMRGSPLEQAHAEQFDDDKKKGPDKRVG